nr:unnamed protein product [Spirometra erinaceieuropaei]
MLLFLIMKSLRLTQHVVNKLHNSMFFVSKVFVVSDIPYAIFGADFLASFNLLVDSYQSRLYDKTINLTVRGIASSDASCQLAILGPELLLTGNCDILRALSIFADVSSLVEVHSPFLLMPSSSRP